MCFGRSVVRQDAPYFSLLFAVVFAVAFCAVSASVARADVIVLANRTHGVVEARVTLPGDKPRTYKLDPRQVVPVPVVDEATIDFKSGKGQKQHRIAANSIVYFVCKEKTPDVVELVERGFSKKHPLPAVPKLATAEELARLRKIGVIPVKIFVDDDEPAVKMLWEKRLKDRVEQASDILEQFCRIRLKVAETGTWDSQDEITDFKFSIREFEKEVRPGKKAALAIGFSSQYKKPSGRVHMGGTRGPMHPYILIREWSQHVAYSERLEIVVHEVGHVLGAAHSPDVHSVMRPLVSDGNARERSFKIIFDPQNTLAMYLFCEELRLRNVTSLRQLRPQRRELLCRIYRQMQKEMPKDTSAQRYITLLQRSTKPLAASHNPAVRRDPAGTPKPTADSTEAKTLVAATRVVVDAVRRAAESRQHLEGDRLTEFYVRRAARAAEKLPPKLAKKAFLLGLAIGLNKPADFEGHAALARLVGLIESDRQRQRRLAVLGNPTMNGRADLAQHFAISSALTALIGKDGARSIGIAKETADSRGGSGFSFRDLSANLAGIIFAKHLLDSKLRLSDLAAMFSVDGFLPVGKDLPEGLSAAEFKSRLGSTSDKRFRDKTSAIEREILTLPGYASGVR